MVLVFAADAITVSDDLSGLDHGHPDRGPFLHQLVFGVAVQVHVAAAGDKREGFNAAADGNRRAFIDDRVGGVGNRLQARRTETVDCGTGRRGRAAGPERGVAGHIVSGRAFRLRAA